MDIDKIVLTLPEKCILKKSINHAVELEKVTFFLKK